MDLSVILSGHENCEKGHFYGPTVRKCYLFHYVTQGCGVYETPLGVFPVHAGQGFLIFPGTVTRYQADECTPWSYAWLGFRGSDAPGLIRRTGLTEENPVFEAGPIDEIENCLRQIYRDYSALPDAAASELAAAAGAMRFIALISAAEDSPRHLADAYYQKAMWYIRAHLERAITVEEMAAFVGLSRSQLFRAFRQVAGVSPSEALAQTRASQARTLLRTTTLSLSQIAASCGYATAAHFSAAFRRDCGRTPSEYRARPQED